MPTGLTTDGSGPERAGPGRPSPARSLARVFLTLRGRLILLVCFTTVPSMLFIFIAAARERESALELMETEARHLGSLASREHAHHLNGGRSLLLRLSASLACEDPARSMVACPDYLPALLSGFPQFANIGVATPGGEIACSAAPISPLASLRSNEAFDRALGSTEVETGTYAVGFIGRPVLHLAHAVRRADRVTCAVAFVAVELGWLDQLAEQADLPADYSLLITDRTGRVLARSGATTHGAGPDDTHPIPALAVALERPRGVVMEMGSPPTSRYVVATPMEDAPGIFVVASLPYEQVRAAANRAFYRTLAGLILVTVLAVASAVVAAEFSVLRALRALTRVVRRFGAGDLSARAPLPASHGELRELAVSFSHMADALSARQREALEAQDRLRALSQRLQVARDEEAGRIARELHDELGQVLTGLKLALSTLGRACAPSAGAAATEPAIARMSEQIDRAIDSVRRLSSELRPPVLDRLGLAAAVDWLVRDREETSGLAIILNVHNLKEPIDPLVSITLFRIVQEALTNVIRHADATEVSVDLVGDESALALTIHDNGKGIDAATAGGPQSLGILGMRERVHLVGGSFRMEGGPGRGTTIVVSVARKPPPAAGTPGGGEQHP